MENKPETIERDIWNVSFLFGETILNLQKMTAEASIKEETIMMLKCTRQIISLLQERAKEKGIEADPKEIIDLIHKAEQTYKKAYQNNSQGMKSKAYDQAITIQDKTNDLVMKLGIIYRESGRQGAAAGRAK